MTISGLAAPNPIRVSTPDRQGQSLTDSPHGLWRLRSIVGDLHPADTCLVLEIDLGAVVDGALLACDFYYNPLLSADHEVWEEGSRYTLATAFLTPGGEEGIVRACDQGICASDSELGRAGGLFLH